ncbi:RNA polymerase sigma factor [Amycolatopsis sp., V23-08]|uniref:RNA polymerase sigma factor n=1 Tax=Amycolatopsis heterodermiae TaxID=3110235 RepID=A0ABU5RIV4_9PSEU|nr:RNA polymerase sigma factor [Amycolatopsis sp., V23-08]MEA5366226.1 RNA polymerase sigma factor [Amycolatopsis sp., V23-08]
MSDEGETTDADEREEGDLGDFREIALAAAPLLNRPATPPLKAVWNGDGETAARVVAPSSDKVGTPRLERFCFDNFYLTHRPALLAKLVKFCAGDRDLAEDAVQETFFTAYQYLGPLSEHPNPAGWLYLVATRAAMKFFTRETPTDKHEDEASSDNSLDEMPIDLVDLMYRVLSEEERQVIEYRYLLGQRRQWVADRMGLKLRTVDNRIKTALTKLRDHLAEPKGDQS